MPEGSNLGRLLVIICVNDLLYHIDDFDIGDIVYNTGRKRDPNNLQTLRTEG